jgi:hypothetical protein
VSQSCDAYADIGILTQQMDPARLVDLGALLGSAEGVLQCAGTKMSPATRGGEEGLPRLRQRLRSTAGYRT